jgi:hypothetical protein
MRAHVLDEADDPLHVLLDRDRHVGQHGRALRPGDDEQVRETAGGEAEIGPRAIRPLVLQPQSNLRQNPYVAYSRAVGEVFHITSDDVYTWDQIYPIVGGALGTEPRIVHIASEDIMAGAPDWFWSELILGDLSHSAVRMPRLCSHVAGTAGAVSKFRQPYRRPRAAPAPGPPVTG